MIKSENLFPNTIAERALTSPTSVFLREAEGRTYTYQEVHEHGRRWMAAMKRAGMKPGDRVATMTPIREIWLAAWLGICEAGVIEASINTEYQGTMLRYVLDLGKPRLVLVTQELVHRFTPEVLSGTSVEAIVVLDADAPEAAAAIPVVGHEEFLRGATVDAPYRRVEADEVACLILTSGTTGPSKYVLVPWGALYSGATGPWPVDELTAEDCFYVQLPIYHVAGRFCICTMALVGGSVLMRDRFSLGAFWGDVKQHQCTLTVMAWFANLLWDQPVRPDDADNPLRGVLFGPTPTFYREMEERFGFRSVVAFGMSEGGVPIRSGWHPPNHLTCGKARKDELGLQLRIVDEDGRDVAPGATGEMILRAAEPSVLASSYFGMPELSAHAWRDGWLHSGDGFRADEDGNLYFVDRMKDAIRRRGENISSVEIEALLNSHPAVQECAAVAVPSERGEDDVLIYVVRCADAEVTHEELHAHMVKSAPRFMVPKYLEIIASLPKTPVSSRIRKVELRARGIGPETWEAPDVRALTPRARGRHG